jgi:hypothetical protein
MKEEDKALNDYNYPRGASVGLPGRTTIVKQLQYPTDIDWERDLQFTPEREGMFNGTVRGVYRFSFASKARRTAAQTSLAEAVQAIRSIIVTELEGVGVENIQDLGSRMTTDPHSVHQLIGQLVFTGIDVEALRPHEAGDAYTDDNSLTFLLRVEFDAAQAEKPIRHRVVVEQERAAITTLTQRFGPLTTRGLHTVPDPLRPRVPSWFDEDSEPVKPVFMPTPPKNVVVSSSHIQWKPSDRQRRDWIIRNGHQQLPVEQWDEVIRQLGPRAMPGFHIVSIVEDQRVDMELRVVKRVAAEHGKYLGGALPFLRPGIAIRNAALVTGQTAVTVARTCPKRCFDLVADGKAVDIEDIRGIMTVHAAKDVQLSAPRPDACIRCNQCKTIPSRLIVMEDNAYILFHVNSNGNRHPRDMIAQSIAILVRKRKPESAPPQDITLENSRGSSENARESSVPENARGSRVPDENARGSSVPENSRGSSAPGNPRGSRVPENARESSVPSENSRGSSVPSEKPKMFY